MFQRGFAEGIVVDEEFYDQYKDLKTHLRTTAVTLSEQDRADIADFDDFRKQARYLLKIRDEGGLPLNSEYRELQEMRSCPS